IVLFIPAAAGVICMFLEDWRQIRLVAAIAVVLNFILAMVLLGLFEITRTPVGGPHWVFQFSDRLDWVSSLGITYWVGVDGVSIFLVSLTTLMMAIAVLAAVFMIDNRVKSFMVFMLFLETGILGVFMAINLFLFYVFWEAMLIPMYFLLGMWGEQRRAYATMKFLVYTIFGSFLMLVAIFYLWAQTGTLDMAGPGGLIAHPVNPSAQTWLFLAFFLAFAIKMAIWPFHTWAPTAYTESPIPVVIPLAGILSKAGAFGLLRYCLPLFPDASRNLAGLVWTLAVIGVLYAAVMALVQRDIKRIVSYASISHMNLIALGIFALNATGFDGSVLQMINHSLIITGLFLAVAYIVARTGTRLLPEMGGLGTHRPLLMWLFFVFVLAALDLPGLGSFAGEFLILAGLFRANAWYSAIAAVTTILAAWYMIRFFQNSMNGAEVAPSERVAEKEEDLTRTPYEFPLVRRLIGVDLTPKEVALFIPLILLIVYIGIQPDPLTARMNPTTDQLTSLVHTITSVPGLGGGK
ncbi:MAG: NADH-quinone oxidoreductase subunit M, partial [Chloroflexota bacterium]|nr:NADH-quinone oxidoreductase subunit M [Chloroflexota bacterium]